MLLPVPYFAESANRSLQQSMLWSLSLSDDFICTSDISKPLTMMLSSGGPLDFWNRVHRGFESCGLLGWRRVYVCPSTPELIARCVVKGVCRRLGEERHCREEWEKNSHGTNSQDSTNYRARLGCCLRRTTTIAQRYTTPPMHVVLVLFCSFMSNITKTPFPLSMVRIIKIFGKDALLHVKVVHRYVLRRGAERKVKCDSPPFPVRRWGLPLPRWGGAHLESLVLEDPCSGPRGNMIKYACCKTQQELAREST